MTNRDNQKIEKIISKVRPYIQMHGGDVKLEKVEKRVVILEVSGACTHCSLSDLTYNKIIGGILKEEVPSIKKIEFKFIK